MNETRKYDMAQWLCAFCYIIAFLIPLAKKYVPGFIFLLGLAAIVHLVVYKKTGQIKKILPLVLIALLYFMLLAGYFFTSHPGSAQDELEFKLSFIAFPLIALLIPDIPAKFSERILNWFVYGTLLFIPVAIGYGTYQAIQLNDFSYLSYQKLGINYHPTYAATYQAMALFILLKNGAKSLWLFNSRVLHFIAFGCCIIFISMLASKAGILAAMLSILMGTWYILKENKHLKNALVIGFLSTGLCISSALFLPGISDRIDGAMNDVKVPPAQTYVATEEELPGAHSSTALRWVTWGSGWNVMQKNPLGVGTGNTESAMIEEYHQKGEEYAAHKKLNTHNQFLQTGAEHGWPGLMVLCLSMSMMLITAIRNKDILFTNFILLCGMNFLFESFLEVQAGIVFFCFFALYFLKRKI
jgi:O-antigen ligase